MKLQIKDSGAWRNVMDFAVEEVEAVKNRAEALMWLSASAGRIPELRICDTMRAVLHWTSTNHWQVPRFAEGHTWVP